MANNIAHPAIERKPPRTEVGVLGWLKKNLFDSWSNSVLTILILAFLLWTLPALYHWAFGGAVFRVDLAACKALEGDAACWGMITEKYRIILFGRFPYDEQWRALIAMSLMVLMLVLSCLRAFWHWWLLPLWLLMLIVHFSLMFGFEGSTILPPVESELWGGLPLTIMLSVLGIVLSFPFGIILALGRQSNFPIIKSISIVYIEVLRGIPFITVLFLASFMFPLFAPPGFKIPALLRVEIGIFLFSAAYLAEVVRGGLQALPKGQLEAAQSMGLSYWQSMRLIILPQALQVVVPPLVNSFIATFKDTSLVTIVGIFDLLGALKLAFGDPVWRPFSIEGFLFISMIYFAFNFSMSRYSQYLEKSLNKDNKH